MTCTDSILLPTFRNKNTWWIECGTKLEHTSEKCMEVRYGPGNSIYLPTLRRRKERRAETTAPSVL
ncbi:hypothetical protein PHAMO_180098 [Magnetospirillum molischianum DSM 120]|uniref:Uncharacterized protein n=1 Tax=Magnetospirillum molischianum DSM 120 TaxID=1150626 RepID=H8FP41_MAGML|nr:hypothetical protein PHAMO_180098 [Magnetospirillum molischianum DSM 120]